MKPAKTSQETEFRQAASAAWHAHARSLELGVCPDELRFALRREVLKEVIEPCLRALQQPFTDLARHRASRKEEAAHPAFAVGSPEY